MFTREELRLAFEKAAKALEQASTSVDRNLHVQAINASIDALDLTAKLDISILFNVLILYLRS
jgi:hypothetical protein